MPKINEIKLKLSENDYSICLSKPWDNQELIDSIYTAEKQVKSDNNAVNDTHFKSSLIMHNSDSQSLRLATQIMDRFSDITDIFQTKTDDELFIKLANQPEVSAVIINHDSGNVSSLITRLKELGKQVILTVPPAFAMANSNDQSLKQVSVMTKPISFTRLEPVIQKLTSK